MGCIRWNKIAGLQHAPSSNERLLGSFIPGIAIHQRQGQLARFHL